MARITDLEDADTESLVNELCGRMKLKPTEAERFKHNVMLRCGFKPDMRYVAADRDDNQTDYL